MLTTKIQLEKLSFGSPAAERDDDLFDCFVSINSFKNIKQGGKNIVLGNRGSGKSALFKKLKQEEMDKGNLIICLAPEEYSYEMLCQVMIKEKEGAWAKYGAYAAAWKYLIYVLIMKEVTNNDSKFKMGAAEKIYNYLRDNHANVESNPIGVLISYLKRLECIKVGSFEAGIKVRQLQSLYKLEEIMPLILDLEKLCLKKKVYVLVDELDKGWDNSEDARAFIAGLFQAAISINQNTKNIRILISLRKELYDNIPELYEDAQKVRDLIEIIEWDEQDLLELISRRIGKSFSSISGLSHEKKWNAVFAETLDYRKTSSFNYVVDRTLYRPREIMQFCNSIRDKAIEWQKECPLDYGVIAESEYNYSEGRLQDIAAEYRFQYPGLLSVFETFRGLSYTFSRNDLEEHILRIACRDLPISNDAEKWCNDADLEFLIETLWKVGFLRAQAVGGLKARRRSGSSYLGPHQISNLNLRNIQRFHIHPMFRSFLGLKESK
jgi:energy-coupling factor transporter ATP-binding protein EcfA2